MIKYQTEYNNNIQNPHRPKILLHSIQNDYVEPDLVVDVSYYFPKKMESVKCFKSQFFNPKSDEPESFISSKEFLEFITSTDLIVIRDDAPHDKSCKITICDAPPNIINDVA